MPGVVPAYEHGPITFEVSENVTGGQLVEPDSANAGLVHPAAAGSALCLGVATTDAVPADTAQNSTVPIGQTAYNASPIDQYTGVANNGVWKLKASAAIDFGERVIPAANGQVAPVAAAGDASIGWCAEPDGIASGSVGLIVLTLG